MKDPNRAPFYASMYHGLCQTARKHGYALAIHGTLDRDLDLVAIPWTEEAGDPITLKDDLMRHIHACDYADVHRRQGFSEELVQEILKTHDQDAEINGEKKPHGRRSWNLYHEHGSKVDLSVMPRIMPTP
jgi:hypothetical protein